MVMFMKKAICFIFDENYASQGAIALASAKKHNPEHTVVLLTDNKNVEKNVDIQLSPTDIGLSLENWLLIGRIAIVQYCLRDLNFDTVIFIDGDTYTYNSYYELQKETENHSLVVIPHITKPLPNDEHFPQNRTISLSGNYNTGVWGASKSGLDFIDWWREQTTLFPISAPQIGLVNEQGWLRFAADFNDNVKIFRHPGYNVAYWNIKQRCLSYINNTWYIDNEKLAIMHFSGLKQDIDPSQMSIFQNRYSLEKNDLAYKLFESYHSLVWSQSQL